jgi:hypothetical protein
MLFFQHLYDTSDDSFACGKVIGKCPPPNRLEEVHRSQDEITFIEPLLKVGKDSSQQFKYLLFNTCFHD